MPEEVICEERGTAAVAWLKGTKHRYYEDRYRMLSNDIPLVQQKRRGEIFAVFDGIGSAVRGRDAAQEMTDQLIRFYRESDEIPASREGIHRILMEGNQTIMDWGCMPGTDRPLGGCAGTIAWSHGQSADIFHAGDTVAYLIRGGVETTTEIYLHSIGDSERVAIGLYESARE
jgi:serine/threonine protein phosphatase PrpC